jgi:hypothetical protein
MVGSLILKRAPIGWNQDDFDVLEKGQDRQHRRLHARMHRHPAGRGARDGLLVVGAAALRAKRTQQRPDATHHNRALS